ncbi:hypothetical protein GCM10025867_49490 (plasmid) [Frondihabitans sucicola]|uniref:Uncharacterized protein n=1 Tax=Frondihabitans sucicola TaxID=1268041 RepID=A0ABM8GW55_9MICO|nr:hypothetical protein [Frondihabitans sucicola]BDZ52708.1 hypothetical protein GCM10025867_49490 [Frondihabitans sucicola]
MSDLHTHMARFDREMEATRARLKAEMAAEAEAAAAIAPVLPLPTPALARHDFYVTFGDYSPTDFPFRSDVYEQVTREGFVAIEAPTREWATALALVHFGEDFAIADEDPRHPDYPLWYHRGEIGRISVDGELAWATDGMTELLAA